MIIEFVGGPADGGQRSISIDEWESYTEWNVDMGSLLNGEMNPPDSGFDCLPIAVYSRGKYSNANIGWVNFKGYR